MTELKAGLRLRSTVSTTEVVVVRASTGAVLECGGQPMTHDSEPAADSPADSTQLLLGKRYVTPDDSIEVLCVKPGVGPLTARGVELVVKTAKPLPASD